MPLHIELPENVTIEHSGGDGWTILHGDALRSASPFSPPDSFDALITDPPYASGGWNQNREKPHDESEIQQHAQRKGSAGFHRRPEGPAQLDALDGGVAV